MKNNKRSYLKNVIVLVVSICAFATMVITYACNGMKSDDSKWPNNMLDTFLVFVGVIGFFLIFYESILIHHIKKRNDSIKLLPYNFDYQREYEIYVDIGNKKNRNIDKEVVINKYSEWEKYIRGSNYYSAYVKNEDFFRFLVRSYRDQAFFVDMIIKLYLPITIAILTFYWNINTISGMKKGIGIILTMMFLMVYTYRRTFEGYC